MKTNTIAKWFLAVLSTAALSSAGQTVANQTATSPEHDKQCTGKVMSVNDQQHTVTVRKMLIDKTFSVGSGCAITRWDQTPGTIIDLRPGQKVTVGYQNAQGVLVAARVEQMPLRYTGMVKVIDPNEHKLVLHTSWDRDRMLTLSDNCRVVLRDKEAGLMSDIVPGDHVTVVYEAPSGLDTARQIAQTSASFTGSLTAIDLRSRTVSARDIFGDKQFNLAKDCAIVIDGRTDAPLMNLRPGQRLVFNYDEINGVNVANRIAPAQKARDAATAQANP